MFQLVRVLSGRSRHSYELSQSSDEAISAVVQSIDQKIDVQEIGFIRGMRDS